jgi:hypothetical protein
MQPDMGGLWRQDVLRRIHETQLAEAAARPTPAPPRRISRWRAVAGWVRARLRRGSSPAPLETSESPSELGDAINGPAREVVLACEQALEARPDLVPLWVGLSLAAARVGDLELAEGAYDVARVLSADEADAWRDAFERDFPEIDLGEAVEVDIAVPDRLATSDNGR